VTLQIIQLTLGAILVGGTLYSALEAFVLPRGAPDLLTRGVFFINRLFFAVPLKIVKSYTVRDRIMALYAPISLLAMVPVWYLLIATGYSLMYLATGAESWASAFYLSGSSLLTLGFSSPTGFLQSILVFTEATLGLILVALLIAYLPTMYGAFSRRAVAVTLLEVRAGSPPSAVEMLRRFQRIHGLNRLEAHWQSWENWFADIDESHTSLAPLVFFRSPRPEHSWVTAAGAVMDAAALSLSTLDIPEDPQAALCIRAGYLALQRIGDYFNIDYNPDAHFPADHISISRAEFDLACEQLAEEGVPLKADRNQAWLDFAGWRVNYDQVLLGLAGLTMAPKAPWSSDRVEMSVLPPLFKFRKSGRPSKSE
jgi:hypothetical protein